jgi:hypothetical protein
MHDLTTTYRFQPATKLTNEESDEGLYNFRLPRFMSFLIVCRLYLDPHGHQDELPLAASMRKFRTPCDRLTTAW